MLSDRQRVVTYRMDGTHQSYTLPYLFQSVDTANDAATMNCCVEATNGGNGILNDKLSICDSELTNALKYTDSYGRLGSHPNYPPFPLCRNKISAARDGNWPSIRNPASVSEGYPLIYENDLAADPRFNTDEPGFHRWVTADWIPSITVPTPDALVKTVSSGTM